MYICPHCSAENKVDANFCRDCGQRRRIAGPQPEDENHCPCCSRRVRHTDRFCINCGEKLRDRPHPDTKMCLSCSTLLPLKAAFCMSCGEYVADKSTRKVELSNEVFSEDNPDLTPRFEA